MNPKVKTGLAALFAAGLLIPSFAQAPNPDDETTAEIEAEEKVQTVTILQDDAQKDMVSKTFLLKHAKAADLAPFVKSAAIRFDSNSSVTCMEDKANSRQLLIVSTTVPMMPYIDEMVEALDRPGKMNDYDTIISGTGIAYGTYKPQYRSAKSMLKVIKQTGISSGPLDSVVKLDNATGMFYFKDTPSRVADIKAKLEWLDKDIPQTKIELKVYEVRNSDLIDVGVDYLAWKNGPGLNLFDAAYDVLSIKAAETILTGLTQTGADLFGTFTYGFGGFYTAPAFDFSFIRLLQQNGRATINSTAGVTVSNNPEAEFKASFSPEYQNILKDDDHRTSVDVGGDASLEMNISEATIAGTRENGGVTFAYELSGSNVVERNNMGAEISEGTSFTGSISLPFGQEKLLACWERKTDVEQTIGIPFLCELPVLKYIFGTTTSNADVVHYLVTARAVPVRYNESVEPGVMAEFDELAAKKK
ncbi:MAG: hypothetical protein IKL85_00990 [Lentisphaeria bacterium]|nr:hypothetical protein [Lentisphaeria bacterium]